MESEEGLLRWNDSSDVEAPQSYDSNEKQITRNSFSGLSILLQSVSDFGDWTLMPLRCICSAVVPSFAQALWHGDRTATPQKLRHTAALDGLRGLACLSVMNYHILYIFQGFLYYGYGVTAEAVEICGRPEDISSTNTWFHQLPIFRLVYSGTAPVSLFYVISGFVLSCKPLLLARRGQQGHAFRAVASSTLRRGIRLFLPTAVATFITMVAIRLRAYEPSRTLSEDSSFITGIPEHHTVRLDTFGAQVLHWLSNTAWMTRAFSWKDYYSRYDVHLWTIPAEFHASMALFLVMIVYLALGRRARRMGLGCLLVYTYLWNQWEVALFFAGLWLADSSQSSHSKANEPADESCLPSAEVRQYSFAPTISKLVLYVLSLHLLSSPDFCMEQTPGYVWLAYLIPSTDHQPFRFLPMLGSILFVGVLSHTSRGSHITRFLESCIPQYLGKISYSLYIVHGPIIHMVGYLAFDKAWQISGKEEVLDYCVGFAAAYTLILVIVVCVADCFSRAVDERCVRFAAWFEGLITVSDDT